jgi:general secretion pathway protein D
MNIIKNFKLKITFPYILLSICTLSTVNGKNKKNTPTNTIIEQEAADINVNYNNTDIITIINEIAALKELNVILPPGDLSTIKVTLHREKKITLTQAWNLLNTLLDIAEYFIVPEGSIIRIVKRGKEISREPMPTYIGVSPDDLPNTDQPIRYLYYLANIRISSEPDNELNGILKDILPENAFIKGDSVTNSLLLIAKANDIRAAMKIITELDQVNFQEKIDIITLRHTSATIVARLINERLIKPENANPYRLDTKKAKEVPYFSGFTKVIPETRLNKLIMLGRPQAVERLKDFIKKYIDVAPDSGESVLHVYKLQYLDAQALAPVLDAIVRGGETSGPSQASAGESTAGGVERFFDKVIIYTDYPTDRAGDSANSADKQRYTYYGGNNLVIAARNDDWKQIKKLIEELDIPQKQVLIEVLIADLTVEDARTLGAQVRIPEKIPFPDSMEFQSAMLTVPIPSTLPTVPPAPGTEQTTINSDLLANALTNKGVLANPSTEGTNNIADFAASGTTLLSLNDNDGKTWGIWELLQLFTNSKILSHPHIMARNNEEATVEIGQTRWLTDKVKDVASNYYGGATAIQQKPISALLKVFITPRISSASTVNLQVLVTIDEFQSAGSNTIIKRKVETNANIKSGGIFALGGLIRTSSASNIKAVPFLSKIPILGWFFKNKSNDIIKNNLTVFISPTIVEPRLRDGLGEYTQDYINVAKSESRGNLFDSLRDPITRWFFTGEVNTELAIDKFVAKDETLPANEIVIKKTKPKKSLDKQREIDETDILTHKSDGFVAENNLDQFKDLKKIFENEPNPFLRT